MTNTPNHPLIIRIVCLATLAMAGVGVAQGQASTREERAAKLNSKVTELRSQFKLLRGKLDEASDQAKSNLRAELSDAGRELSTAYGELESNYDAELRDWKLAIEQKWEQAAAQTEQFKTETAKEMEQTRQSWSSSYNELRKTYHQHVDHLQARLNSLEKEAESTIDGLSDDWLSTRIAARKQYQQTAQQMRLSYQRAIAELESEIVRLEQKAKDAGDEASSMLTVMADSLTSDMQFLQEELHGSYEKSATKMNRYLATTKTQLKSAGDEIRAEIRTEADQMSQASCQLHAEMMEHCDTYRASLDKRVAAIRQRVTTAKGEAKQKLEELAIELDAKSKKAAEQSESAQQAYRDSLSADIDYAKQQLEEAGDQVRAAIIKRIEKRQAELDQAKRKLQSK